jgi:hypothetical protein
MMPPLGAVTGTMARFRFERVVNFAHIYKLKTASARGGGLRPSFSSDAWGAPCIRSPITSCHEAIGSRDSGRRDERRHGNVQRVHEASRGIGQFDLAFQLLAERSDQACPKALPGRSRYRGAAFFRPRHL